MFSYPFSIDISIFFFLLGSYNVISNVHVSLSTAVTHAYYIDAESNYVLVLQSTLYIYCVNGHQNCWWNNDNRVGCLRNSDNCVDHWCFHTLPKFCLLFFLYNNFFFTKYLVLWDSIDSLVSFLWAHMSITKWIPVHTTPKWNGTLCIHPQTSYKCIKSPNLNVSRLILQMSLSNPLKPGVKLRRKMKLEQRRQAMLQLHLSDKQFHYQQMCPY